MGNDASAAFVSTIGFLHTAGIHVGTFDALVAEHSTPAEEFVAVHLVEPSLLDDARTLGFTDALAKQVTSALHELSDRGAFSVVCTCSTIGALAETCGRELGVSVVRVDRPMARRAVQTGSRLLVVAALASTVDATRALLVEEAALVGLVSAIELLVVDEAWTAFEAGDMREYFSCIETKIRRCIAHFACDVVVLAQASMAGCAALLDDLGIPVLSSPSLAVEALMDRARQPLPDPFITDDIHQGTL